MKSLHCLTALSTLSFIALGSQGFAAEVAPLHHSGMYLSAHGEGVFISDDDITLNGIRNGEAQFDTGFGVGGSIGYDFSDINVRVETELTYRANDTTLSLASPAISANDSLDTMALMANMYYDMDLQLPVVPYVGIGAGAIDIDGDQTVFAYQGMAGLTLPFSDRHELYAGYRYLGTNGVKITNNSNKLTHDYDAHIAEIGFRVFY